MTEFIIKLAEGILLRGESSEKVDLYDFDLFIEFTS
jgi:hypothetical protein